MPLHSPMEVVVPAPTASGVGGNRDFITRFTPDLLFGADCGLVLPESLVCAFGVFGGSVLGCADSVPADVVERASRDKRELTTRFAPRLCFSSTSGLACSAVGGCVFGSVGEAVCSSASLDLEGELTTH